MLLLPWGQIHVWFRVGTPQFSATWLVILPTCWQLKEAGLSGSSVNAGERHSFALGSMQRRSMSINIHSSSLSRGPSHQYSTPQVGSLSYCLASIAQESNCQMRGLLLHAEPQMRGAYTTLILLVNSGQFQATDLAHVLCCHRSLFLARPAHMKVPNSGMPIHMHAEGSGPQPLLARAEIKGCSLLLKEHSRLILPQATMQGGSPHTQEDTPHEEESEESIEAVENLLESYFMQIDSLYDRLVSMGELSEEPSLALNSIICCLWIACHGGGMLCGPSGALPHAGHYMSNTTP